MSKVYVVAVNGGTNRQYWNEAQQRWQDSHKGCAIEDTAIPKVADLMLEGVKGEITLARSDLTLIEL